MPRTLTYTIAFPEPHTHLFDVRMRIPLVESREALDLAMAAWTPGSYRIRDYARHVQDLVAMDADSGTTIPATKIDKQTWRLAVGGSKLVNVQYRVYANELTVRTAHLDERHAYWNGAALLLYVVGETDRRAHVVLEGVREDWVVATGLDRAAEDRHEYLAADFDALVDAPFACGPLEVADLDIASVRHRLAIDGEGNYDLARLREDVTKIVETELAMFGGKPPYPHYTFILHCVPEGQPGGGLEHARSTTLAWGRFRFRPREKYEEFLSLVAHEFFHLWNGKRLRPRELGPFDYRAENYTRSLWIVEGVTSYYDELILRRAGLIDAEAYLRKVAEHVERVENTPGRLHQSLAEASFDAWIKYYQRTEHSVNAQISYYEKGQLVAMLLDLEIRHRSAGSRSLDDVVRALYEEHPETGVGYEAARFEAIASEMASFDLQPFFDAYVRETAELDYDLYLAPFGLRLLDEPKKDGDGPKRSEPEVRAWLGANVKADGPRALVSEVLEGSPAFLHGLMAGDEILALDGFKVGASDLDARLHDHKPGDRAKIVVFRGDRLLTIEIVLGGKKWSRRAIRPRPDATHAERTRYEAWLGEAFPSARTSARLTSAIVPAIVKPRASERVPAPAIRRASRWRPTAASTHVTRNPATRPASGTVASCADPRFTAAGSRPEAASPAVAANPRTNQGKIRASGTRAAPPPPAAPRRASAATASAIGTSASVRTTLTSVANAPAASE
jgi:predicted metalloprotease with PDZ domain